MKQLPFVFEDIKRSKLYYLRFFIQMLAVLLLSGYCISILSQMSDFLGKFRIFDELPEAYIIREAFGHYAISSDADAPDYLDRLRALNDYISSMENVKLCARIEKIIPLPIDKPIAAEEFSVGISKETPEGYFPLLSISRGFMEVYELSVSEGRSLESADFGAENSGSEYAPALIGSGYKDYYKLGDILKNEYEVVGILEDDAFYLWPGASGGVYYLRDSIITPAIPDETEGTNSMLSEMLGFSMIFTNDPDAVSEYTEKANELRVFSGLKAIGVRDQLEVIIADYKTLIYTYGGIAALALIFCVSCSIASMLNYIDARKNEIFIHMLVGAKKRDVLVRLAVPPAAMLLTASLAALAVFRDLRVFALLLGFDCVLLLGMMLLPALKLKRQKLHELIKER